MKILSWDMLGRRRVGRPKSALSQSPRPVTGRIRQLIDTMHDGNVAAASRLTGIPYATLRDLYVGRSANPSLRVLEMLGAPYGLPPAAFAPGGPTTPPSRPGRVVLLPPSPKARQRALRELFIPAAGEEILHVFQQLEGWLANREPGAERPVIGEATGDAAAFRLAAFLLQPLLAAERLGAEVIPGEALNPMSAEREAAWVRRLNALGRMWSSVLVELPARQPATGAV